MAVDPLQPQGRGTPGNVRDGANVRGSAPSGGSVREVVRVQPADRIEISAQGRALAAQLAAGAESTGGGASAERIQQLRERTREGYYDSAQVRDEIAQRLLERGELLFETREP